MRPSSILTQVSSQRGADTAQLMESLGNKRIRTDPWMAQLIERIEPLHLVQLIEGNLERAALAGVFPSLILRSFVHLADLVRNPVRRQEELRAAYAMRMRDWRRIKQSLEEMDQASAADQLETRTATPFKTRTIRMTQLATSSGVALVVNRILQSYDPLDVDLIETETTLVRSILDAGRTVLPLRPLGAAHARPALAVAWAVTGNPNHRAQAGEMLSLIKGAVPAIRSISSALFDEDGLAEARWWSVRFDEIDNAIGTTFETRRLEVAQGTPGCHVQ